MEVKTATLCQPYNRNPHIKESAIQIRYFIHGRLKYTVYKNNRFDDRVRKDWTPLFLFGESRI
jgi:hypothetical protein